MSSVSSALVRIQHTHCCLTNHKHKHYYDISPPFFRVFSTQVEAPTPARKPVSLYLKETLGFSEEQSLATSAKLKQHRKTPQVKKATDLITCQRADNVISYLRDTCQISLPYLKDIISKAPTMLGANVDKTLKPRIKLLKDKGFSSSDLGYVLSKNASLYLNYDLGPSILALRGIMGSDEDVVRVFKRLKRGTAPTITKNLIHNVTMLEDEYGISREKMRKFLCRQPEVFLRNTDWFRDVLVRIGDKWGIRKDSALLFAARLCSGFSDECIDSKCQVFRSFGWSETDIRTLVRTNPICLTSSEDRIKKMLEFYMNEVGYDPAYMASRPFIFTISLENRVLPRLRVLSALKEKGLKLADFPLYSFLVYDNHKFVEKFIVPFEHVLPKLREVFANSGEPSEVVSLSHGEDISSINGRGTTL